MKTKIFLVDDHAMLRSGVRQAIAQQPDLEIVGEASTAAGALETAPPLAPDLIIMDVHLPDMQGTEATRQILVKLPTAKIVMFSGDSSRSLVDEALEAGASGYICKQGAAEELVRAIEMVMAGRLYLSPELTAAILEDYRKNLVEEEAPAGLTLSEREGQLLQLVAEGLRNKEIAVRLSLSPKSIETYRARLMRKLGCGSTAEMVRYAIREKLIIA
jgi:DNA-binding NarL/FixJ family response regulator